MPRFNIKKRAYEALEELAHGLVVELVGAVEDDAVDGGGLAEVLDGLGLAGARGTLRRAPVEHLVAAHQRAVTPVRQRRDHQPRRVAQVLESVQLHRVDALHLNLDRPLALLVVVPQLRRPREVSHLLDPVHHDLAHHVPVVHVQHHLSYVIWANAFAYSVHNSVR